MSPAIRWHNQTERRIAALFEAHGLPAEIEVGIRLSELEKSGLPA